MVRNIMTEHSQETKIAILEAKVDHMMGHVTELTKRVRAVEKVCAIVSAVGIAGGGIVGTTVLNPQKAEACSPPRDLDGNMLPFTCPPPDVVCLSLDCPPLPKPQPNIADQVFKDDLDPNAFDHNKLEVTLYDSRIAHMGHSFPTGEWIEKIRDHESRKVRTPVEEMINNTLTDYQHGSNDPTEQEVLLQLPSDGD